jgi:hypothetical protein
MKKWAQSAPIKQKKGTTCPSKNPSFVYRQDGYELSYEIWVIIAVFGGKVKRTSLWDTANKPWKSTVVGEKRIDFPIFS